MAAAIVGIAAAGSGHFDGRHIIVAAGAAFLYWDAGRQRDTEAHTTGREDMSSNEHNGELDENVEVIARTGVALAVIVRRTEDGGSDVELHGAGVEQAAVPGILRNIADSIEQQGAAA